MSSPSTASRSFAAMLPLAVASLVLPFGGGALLAQTVIVPTALASTDVASSTFVLSTGINRVQCIYDWSNFTNVAAGQPIEITSLEFRTNSAWVAGLSTWMPFVYPNVEVYLQECATDHLSPSATFAQNRTRALPTTANYTGSLNCYASGYLGVFTFGTITLAQPYVFVPGNQRDLLIEIVLATAPSWGIFGPPPTGIPISTGNNPSAHACNSVRSVGSTSAATGALSTFCPVLQLGWRAPTAGAAWNEAYGTGCYAPNALRLHGSPSPILGSNLQFTLASLPAGAGPSFHMLGFGSVPGGLDLAALGAGGCSFYLTLPVPDVTMMTGVVPSRAFAIPNTTGLTGLVLHAQAATAAASANALGVVTSNAVRCVIGTR